MCGESLASATISLMVIGSPPHVWGKLSMEGGYMLRDRITPTCVGKAEVRASNDEGRKDHPHMCGESRFLAS